MSKTNNEIADYGKWIFIEVQSLLTRFMDCVKKKIMNKHKLTGKEIATKYQYGFIKGSEWILSVLST